MNLTAEVGTLTTGSSDWTIVVIAAITALAGFLGGLGGAWLMSRASIKTTNSRIEAAANEARADRRINARRPWLEPLHAAAAKAFQAFEDQRHAWIEYMFFEWQSQTAQSQNDESVVNPLEPALKNATKDYNSRRSNLADANREFRELRSRGDDELLDDLIEAYTDAVDQAETALQQAYAEVISPSGSEEGARAAAIQRYRELEQVVRPYARAFNHRIMELLED